MNTPADEIRRIIEAQARAIGEGDADAVMADYASDLVSFDVMPPLRNRGADAVRKRLEDWLASYKGPVGCEIRELEVDAADGIGFCYGLQRFTGTLTDETEVDMWVRRTLCLRKMDGRWLILHEHMSDPFDPETGLTLIDLEP